MAKFLTTRQVSAELETIINDAKNWLFLVSPYLDIPDTLFESIKSADKRYVDIMLIYGKKEKQGDTITRLAGLNHISIRYSENLHAKCYFNEQSMIITSMNLVQYSEINNREMGVLLNKDQDYPAFIDAHHEVIRIIEHAEKVSLKGSSTKSDKPTSKEIEKQKQNENQGYCIRCGVNIDFNTSKPLCPSCFKTWSKWNDPDYSEKFCHHCGRKVETSVNNPVCTNCGISNFSSWVKGIFS